MRRASSGRSSKPSRRARPCLEGLEERLALSQTAGGLSAVAVADHSPSGGVFRNKFQEYFYTTPQGTRVQLKVIGRGSLEGTSVDSAGALHLWFSKTNSFTKIMSSVHGGTGQADLASIYNLDLFTNQAAGSLSGVGASVIHSINLPNFNLIAGGVIDVTSGIANLNLNSVGPATEIQLRELPSTLTAGQSTTSPVGSLSNQFITGAFQVQGLANITGEFITAGTIINTTAPSNEPGPPPAPPGIVLKINHIRGNVTQPPNLLYDAKMFGYDPVTGQVVRFALIPATVPNTNQPNMSKLTGQPDLAFSVQPPGSTAPVGLSVGRDGDRLVLLVAINSTVSVYDATFGTPLGSFSIPPGFNTMASTDTLTVIGNVQSNTLQMVDVHASLAAGTLVPPLDNPAPYTPQPGFNLVGGLTGLPGSNNVYATIAATFNSFQPNVTELGLSTVSTATASPTETGAINLIHRFSTVSQQAIKPGGNFVPVDPANNPELIGTSMGAFDSSLAINRITTNPNNPAQFVNTVGLMGPVSLSPRGTITLNIADPITDLTETYRPDLTGDPAAGIGPALIDVQGNIQSLRGITANGLVLNNTGFLNLIRTGRISNSTILAQPIGHVLTPPTHRTNTTIWSSDNRSFRIRGDVRLVTGLHQIGPLSLTRDKPTV